MGQHKLIRVHTTLLASVCHAMPFSARALKKKHFLWRWYCGKKQIEMWFIVVCTLVDNKYVPLLVSQTFLSYCFCTLSEFEKVFERKVWRVKTAHLHNAARALSSSSRCFQLSRQIFISLFLSLWYCGKKQIECGLAWSVLLSTSVVDSRGATEWVRNKLSYITKRQQHTPRGK